MSVIKEANILNDIPLSLVKAGQIVQIDNGDIYLVIFKGQDRCLVPLKLTNWVTYNIYDRIQPNIVKVFDNKAKGKCLYVKKSFLEEMENAQDI